MNTDARIVSLLCWLFATGLFLTSMLTDFWLSEANTNFGLFNLCSPERCVAIGWSLHPEYINPIIIGVIVPRIIMLAGAGFIAIGLLFGFITLCTKKSCTLVAEGSFHIIGGIVILGACATFTGLLLHELLLFELRRPQPQRFQVAHFHYSFYFGWISGLLYIVSGSCAIIAGSSKYN